MLHFHFMREVTPLTDNPEATVAALVEAAVGRTPSFDDLPFYLNLRARPGCARVDLFRVRVIHNNFVLGLQSVYRCTSRDGSVSIIEGPTHTYGSSRYAFLGGMPDSNSLVLEDREHVAAVGTREGDILDAVHFVTNCRRVHFGGYGGTHHPVPGVNYDSYNALVARVRTTRNRTVRESAREFDDGSHPFSRGRVVAFNGIAKGVIQRIGYYTESAAWDIVGPIVMIRWLVERGRAKPSAPDLSLTKPMTGGQSRDKSAVMHSLVILQEDMFRQVLLFLIRAIDG